MSAPYKVGDAARLKPGIRRTVSVKAGHSAYKHPSDDGESRYDIATEFDLSEDELQDGTPPTGDPPNYKLRRGLSKDITYNDADRGIVVEANPPAYRVRLYFPKLMNDEDA